MKDNVEYIISMDTELERIEFSHDEATKIVKILRQKIFKNRKTIPALITSLKEKGGLNEKGANGFTLVMHAVLTLSPDTITQLIENGADPTIASVDGLTPVHVAAELEKPDCLIAILAHKGAANAKNDLHSLVPIDHAIKARREENLLILLENGADPNAQDPSGNTPLSGTLTPTSFHLGHILLRNGADPFIKNRADASYIDRIVGWLERDDILTGEGQENLAKTVSLLRELHPGSL